MYKRISSVVFFDISTFQYRGRPRDRARIGASGHQRGQGQMRHTIKAHRHATSTAAAPSRELYGRAGANNDATTQKK